MINNFKEKLEIKEEETLKERIELRADRKKRRDAGEECVSSDTEDEFEGKSEEVVAEMKTKKENDLNEKLLKNAKERFTY